MMLLSINLMNYDQNNSGKKAYETKDTNNIYHYNMSVKGLTIGLYLTCMEALMRHVG